MLFSQCWPWWVLLLLFFCVAGTARVIATEYPIAPIRLDVLFPPGGLNNLLGRIVASEAGVTLGQHIIIDNHTDAGGKLWTQIVSVRPRPVHDAA